MKRKKHTPGQIAKLREADAKRASGKTITEICKGIHAIPVREGWRVFAARVDVHNRVVIITSRLWMTGEKQLCKPPNASI